MNNLLSAVLVFATVFVSVAGAALPSATTNSASNVTSSSGQMNGTINPNSSSTSAYFQWGLTTSYGNTTGPGTFTGTSSININSVLSGAPSNTTYHYRGCRDQQQWHDQRQRQKLHDDLSASSAVCDHECGQQCDFNVRADEWDDQS